MVKRLLWEEFEIPASDEYIDHAHLVWRGSRRRVEVIYGKRPGSPRHQRRGVRPLIADAWRLVIDYPFDEGTHGPADDRGRVNTLRAHQQSRTVC